MKYLLILLGTILTLGECVAMNPIDEPQQEKKFPKEKVILLFDKLFADQISVDAAWEEFSSLVGGKGKTANWQKISAFVGMLGSHQMSFEKTVYRIRLKGPFIRDCSAALSIRRETLLKKYTKAIVGSNIEEECAIFNSVELFIDLGSIGGDKVKDTKSDSPQDQSNVDHTPKIIAEQAGADQPATKPGDKVPAKIQPSTPTSKDAPR
jgi:hypothetical protein